ncbi:MAG: D-glycero-beta-D-manno-heptose 1,7-bisphosphate 7-phosphatase [Immundisolibacteraceae bacterium]|nr:D-glycero-beta-D-manno-heptose 1,7-bisphosphate 7-phosphatase [Immundisolibacteraceae bacterium]
MLLDRDGVINVDSPDYIRSVAQWLPETGSLQAMARLTQAGCRLLVITNQSGIGRGYYNRAELFAMHRKMSKLLHHKGAGVEGVFFCPHLPEVNCDCRKPRGGLLQRAMQCFRFNPEQAVMVGDSARDLAAAKSVGIDAVRVGGDGDYSSLADWVDRLPGVQR